jgi:hypothetical protein
MSCDELWVTAAGETIKVCDMTEQHAKHALNMLLRKHREARDQLKAEMEAKFYRAVGTAPPMGSPLPSFKTTNKEDVQVEIQKFMHDQDFLGTKGASQ